MAEMPAQPSDVDSQRMSIVLFIMFGVLFVILMTVLITVAIRKHKMRKTRKNIFQKAPVVVTSTTHTTPSGYTVTQIPQNASMYQGGYQTTVVTNAAPYPTQPGAMGMPMPGAGMPPVPGIHQHAAPYPPAPGMAGHPMNPPSYDIAVTGGPSNGGVGNNAPYEKQSAYNPNYRSQ